MKSPWPKINGLKLFFAAKSDSADKVWMECMKSDAVIAVHRVFAGAQRFGRRVGRFLEAQRKA